MKLLLENWKRFINEVKEMVCPKPTQDLELNTKNRNAAIQAEDGIRDRSPSRGLGDVYKRQPQKFIQIIEGLVKIRRCVPKFLSNRTVFANFILSLIHI